MKKIYAVILSLLCLNGFAQWSNDPAVNTLVSNTPLIYQFSPQSAPDGSGGLYITWIEYDVLGSTAYIYAQHLSASGNRLWPAAGINVSGTANIYTEPRIVPAGNDGAIIGYSALVGEIGSAHV